MAWQAQSLLLGYPDDELAGRFGLLRQVAERLDTPVGAPLHRFLDHAGQVPVGELAAEYVATFDYKRRCCPYLTYYTHGDTRARGGALLRLKQAYAAAGLALASDELPDHLAVLLEYAAAEPDTGRSLLIEHRAGLERLRAALREAGSPWAHVLDSTSATLGAQR